MPQIPRYVTVVVLLATSFTSVPLSQGQSPKSADSPTFDPSPQTQDAGLAGELSEPTREVPTVSPSVQPSEAAARFPEERPRLLTDPFQTPQQLLRLLDIGPSDLGSFVDGQPISASDEEALLKVLYRMPQIGMDDIARWLQDPVPWALLQAEPSSHRGAFFLLQGRVKTIVEKPVRSRLAALFVFDHYYEADIEVDGKFRVTVCTRTIPQAWLGRHELDQRCQVSGMFLKLNDSAGSQARFLFAAPRIAWLPDRPESDLGIGPAQVLLGDLGMDVGLFDAVRTRNGLPINAAERECFYALLHAAGRAAPGTLAQHTTRMQLGTLLQQPQKLHGNVIQVPGSVQRITRVAVDERDIQQRFGIDHYYQLDVLVPLGDTAVQVKGDKLGEPGPVYRSNFPFTCCALTIPAQWERFVGKEQASARVVIDGFFFKLWAYSNPYVASFDEKQRQWSPMLVLREPTPAATATQGNFLLNITLGIGFLVVLAGIWVGIWLMNRADRKHAASLLPQRLKPQLPPDFEHLQNSDD